MMEILGQIAVLSLLLALAIVYFASYVSMRRLRLSLQQVKSRHEATRRVFNQFVHKLATLSEASDAMTLIAAQICEYMNAQSVGIFIPEISSAAYAQGIAHHQANAPVALHGVSCTSYFPVLSDEFTKGTPTDASIFSNFRYRLKCFRKETVTLGAGLLGKVFETRKPIRLGPDEIKSLDMPLPAGVSTIMILPLMAEDRFAGIICAVNRKYGKFGDVPFTNDDLKEFTVQAATVALTSSLLSIYAERRQQDRLKQELRFSVELQEALLPEVPDKIADIHLAAASNSCLEVCGDFYDMLSLDEDRELILVADATGKGIPACMLTSMCRSFIRCLAEHYTTLETLLMDMNRLVYGNSDSAHYLTANIIVLNKKTGVLELGCAGHTPLLHIHADGTVTEVKPEGPALGMWPNDLASFDIATITLAPHEKICLFTDGINEALNAAGEEYGIERLKETCSHLDETPKQAIKKILDETAQFQGTIPQSDDQTIVLLSR